MSSNSELGMSFEHFVTTEMSSRPAIPAPALSKLGVIIPEYSVVTYLTFYRNHDESVSSSSNIACSTTCKISEVGTRQHGGT